MLVKFWARQRSAWTEATFIVIPTSTAWCSTACHATIDQAVVAASWYQHHTADSWCRTRRLWCGTPCGPRASRHCQIAPCNDTVHSQGRTCTVDGRFDCALPPSQLSSCCDGRSSFPRTRGLALACSFQTGSELALDLALALWESL